MTSTDWQSLGASVIPQGKLSAGSDVHLTLPEASRIVSAASELIMSGSITSWWRMCESLSGHVLLMVSQTNIDNIKLMLRAAPSNS